MKKVCLICALALAVQLWVSQGIAGVVMDGTMGQAGALPGPQYAITSNLGKLYGANLFHSFSEFNLIKGETATFSLSAPASVQNIISRVTGGSESSIDGTIQSTITGANLFFINPAGITFGPNAKLDIKGSFHAGTADYIKLGSDGRFDASISVQPVLTASPPSAFGFVSAQPSPITVQSTGNNYAYVLAGLDVPKGKTLSLIGGNITVTGTGDQLLITSGRRVNLASVASSGEVVMDTDNLKMNGFTSLGNITLSGNSYWMDFGPDPAGNLYIRGNNLSMDNFVIGAISSYSAVGGIVDIRLNGDMRLSGSLSSAIMATGDIRIATKSLTLLGNNSSISSSTLGSGNAGNITLQVGTLTLNGASGIVSDTHGSGNGGMISVAATDSISLDGYSSDAKGNVKRSGIQAAALEGSTGHGGSISIVAPNLIMSNRALVSTQTRSQGKAGSITVDVDTLTMKGTSAISSSTRGSGDAGQITVTARKGISLDGYREQPNNPSKYFNTGIYSDLQQNSSGNGGNIEIKTPLLTLTNRAMISAGVERDIPSGAKIGTGVAGTITLNVGTLSLNDGSTITAETDNGDGGNIYINPPLIDNIPIDPAKLIDVHDSSITATVKGGKGNGGNISLRSDKIVVDESTIKANAEGGNGGAIEINANLLLKSPQSSITASSTFGVQGTVAIKAPDIDVSSGLVQMPTDFLDTNALVPKRCALKEEESSSFVIASEDIPPRPDKSLFTASLSAPETRPGAGAATTRSSTISPENTEETYLMEALRSAKVDDDPVVRASVLNKMGILYASRDNFDTAALAFKQALSIAENLKDKGTAAQVSANYAEVEIKRKEYSHAETLADSSLKLFRGLASGKETCDGILTIGQTYRRLAGVTPERTAYFQMRASNAFVEASELAGQLKDHRTVSYALGYLGQLSEERRDSDEALHDTRRALFAAQQANAHELLATWEWQLGRIAHQKGESDSAMAAYRRAMTNLQTVRQSMYRGCSDGSVPYKDTIEPIYKGLIALLLEKSSATRDRKESERYLLDARRTLEDLKVAEIRDYFKNSCFGERAEQRKSAETFAGDTAIIHVISLPDSIELLLTLPTGVKRFTVPAPADSIRNDVNAFRKHLTELTDDYLIHAKKLYDNLMRPLEPELRLNKIKTLVIIPDDVLRTIPFSALHDGADFLINRYAVATSLGMQLTDAPKAKNNKMTVLAGGISDSVRDYPALPFVTSEISEIRRLFGGETMLNKDFSIAGLKAKVEKNRYSIIHLATHGEFSRDVNKSFIVMWDGQLTIDQFGEVVKSTKYKSEPLDLITLSACNTAVGDDMALLGLAGVAINAGAVSSLATLWEVDDKASSELTMEFYRQLKTGSLSKAQALRNAQIDAVLHLKHPYYWSPFILIGGWM